MDSVLTLPANSPLLIETKTKMIEFTLAKTSGTVNRGQPIADWRIPGKDPRNNIAKTSVRSSVVRLVTLGLGSAVSRA